MSMKIKVNLPYDIYTCLLSDMELFNFKKKDGSVNKNGFINTLFKNYYIDFLNYEKILEKKINVFSLDKENTYQIISLINEMNYDDNYYYDFDLQFILSKENEFHFQIVENHYLRNRTISKYFRDMFISYVSKSQFKREAIVFSDIVKTLKVAINGKKRISLVDSHGKSHVIEPYELLTTKEELYNYLLGVEIYKDGRRSINSIRLYKILDVLILEDDNTFTNGEKSLLELTHIHGAQFPMESENNNIIVSLTKHGIKLFNQSYLNRPKPYKIVDDLYYFNCSYMQIEVYFFKFGCDAKIIEPEFLANRFYYKYLKALKIYRNKSTVLTTNDKNDVKIHQ